MCVCGVSKRPQTLCEAARSICLAPSDAHAEPLATLRLLAVARKHGVESCVDACLQLLLAQVGSGSRMGPLALALLLWASCVVSSCGNR